MWLDKDPQNAIYGIWIRKTSRHFCSPTYNMAATYRYEYSFVLEPDDALLCQICLAVARDPWQHGKCGKLFCEKCINRYGKRKPCPNCRAEQPKYMEDTKSK